MENVLTDGLPEEYGGYAVNTDFETGILIMKALEDDSLSVPEQNNLAVNLLFEGRMLPPDAGTALEALQWLLTGWNHDNHTGDEKQEAAVTDWDIDQWRIYSAFRSQYHINLLEEELHFWEFMALLTTLEECAFTRVADIRSKKEHKGMPWEERKALQKAKRIYDIRKNIDRKENRSLTKEEEDFLKYANIKKKKVQKPTQSQEPVVT